MKYWQQIPSDRLDILITHGPPFGVLDKCNNNRLAGCEDLLEVITHVKPKYHLFGHIHEGYGIAQNGYTTFINASILDENYILKNMPVIFDIKK